MTTHLFLNLEVFIAAKNVIWWNTNFLNGKVFVMSVNLIMKTLPDVLSDIDKWLNLGKTEARKLEEEIIFMK